MMMTVVQNAQEARAAKASLNDLPSSPEVVAYKKNLFEAGEAWSQSPSKAATCKVSEDGQGPGYFLHQRNTGFTHG